MKLTNRYFALAALALVFASTPTAFAAIAGESGKEENYWKTRSVIVAEVEEFTSKPGFLNSIIRLRPLATLSGDFDPGKNAHVEARCEMGNAFVSIIIHVPMRGDKVVVVLLKAPEVDSGYEITNGIVDYMPAGGAALAKIDSLSDPKVGETLKKIKEIRVDSHSASPENRSSSAATMPHIVTPRIIIKDEDEERLLGNKAP